MKKIRVRPEAHEIDTKARCMVPKALPSSWEHREHTGRDYGIDMTVELFKSGCATGRFLLFQIKGTKAKIDRKSKSLNFDIPVNTLRYSELFIVPLLLVICPVNAEKPIFYYLWLQEYIKIVLDHEKPFWRKNKKTVCVKIPLENRMPGDEGKLSFIANFPRRLYDWGQVGRIQHELMWIVDWLKMPHTEELDREGLQKALRLLKEVQDLPGIFGDKNWHWAQGMRRHFVEPGIKAVKLLLRGGPYSRKEVESMNPHSQISTSVTERDQEILSFLIESQLWSSAQQTSTILVTGNDYNLKRFEWQHTGDHDF